MPNPTEIISKLIDKHAQKARESDYDRTVSIAAISASREVILAIPTHLSADAYTAQLLVDLRALHEHYNDPDGEYTNGKGVIGALLDDLGVALRESSG